MRRRSFLAGLAAVVTAFKAGRNPFEEPLLKLQTLNWNPTYGGFRISKEVLDDDAYGILTEEELRQCIKRVQTRPFDYSLFYDRLKGN